LHLAFDPYPFIFLNLILSTVAAIQAPVIMMSQNRQATKDRLNAEHDYVVNLRAELEIMRLHDKLDALREQEMVEILRCNTETLEILKAQVAKMADRGRTLSRWEAGQEKGAPADRRALPVCRSDPA
jgi:uncharacterized membrane protein